MEELICGKTKEQIRICGKTKEQIRKVFFKSELNKMLDEISACQKIEVEDTQKLEAYLNELLKEKKSNNEFVQYFENENELKPPSVDELSNKLTDEQQQKLDEWVRNIEQMELYCKNLMKETRNLIKLKQVITKERYADMAQEIICIMPDIDRLRVYRDQLYRKRLTKIMDESLIKMSRAESEERAKITEEYKNYKLAILLKENLEEFIMICKKRYGINN